MFCALRIFFGTIFKIFSFFPRSLWLFIVLSVPLPHKLTVFLSKIHHFFIVSSSNFKKRYGFSIFLKIFHGYSPWFLGFWVFVEFWKYDARIWVGHSFVEIVLWVLLMLIVWCWYYTYTCLSLSFEYYTWLVIVLCISYLW